MIGRLWIDLSKHLWALINLDLIPTMVLPLLIGILNQYHSIPVHVLLVNVDVIELQILQALSDILSHFAIILITWLNHISNQFTLLTILLINQYLNKI